MLLQASSHYFVYIVTNEDRSEFLSEVTGDLNLRLHQYEQEYREKHPDGNDGRFCKYLVWFEHFTDASEAMRRQAEVEQLSVRKKRRLVEIANPSYRSLNNEPFTNNLLFTL